MSNSTVFKVCFFVKKFVELIFQCCHFPIRFTVDLIRIGFVFDCLAAVVCFKSDTQFSQTVQSEEWMCLFGCYQYLQLLFCTVYFNICSFFSFKLYFVIVNVSIILCYWFNYWLNFDFGNKFTGEPVSTMNFYWLVINQ